jgi:hypothetical protein
MSVWSVSDVTQGITGSLRKAAQATGAGFDYLVKTAMRESSMDPSAKAKTSSAAGMFQFVEQTWFQMVKEEGPKYGLAKEAAAITQSANGRYSVADPKMRERVLGLRYDTEVSSLMAGEFTEKNSAKMSAALRRPPSEGELYAAHFFGAQGAIDLIRLASAAPDAKAATAFPDAASANRSIFYKGGKALSASEVLAKVVSKHDTTPVSPAEMTADAAPAQFVGQGPASFFTNAAPSGPALAYAGGDGQVFHSMFQTAQRPPVSSYVHGIWADLAPAGSAAGNAARSADRASVKQAVIKQGAGGVAEMSARQPLDLSTFLKPGIGAKAGDI